MATVSVVATADVFCIPFSENSAVRCLKGSRNSCYALPFAVFTRSISFLFYDDPDERSTDVSVFHHSSWEVADRVSLFMVFFSVLFLNNIHSQKQTLMRCL